jgi:hypothetical protein
MVNYQCHPQPQYFTYQPQACERARNTQPTTPARCGFVEVLSSEQHIHKALHALKILRTASMSTKELVDDVLDKAQQFISAVRDNSGESKWMYKFFERCTGKAWSNVGDIGRLVRTFIRT